MTRIAPALIAALSAVVLSAPAQALTLSAPTTYTTQIVIDCNGLGGPPCNPWHVNSYDLFNSSWHEPNAGTTHSTNLTGAPVVQATALAGLPGLTIGNEPVLQFREGRAVTTHRLSFQFGIDGPAGTAVTTVMHAMAELEVSGHPSPVYTGAVARAQLQIYNRGVPVLDLSHQIRVGATDTPEYEATVDLTRTFDLIAGQAYQLNMIVHASAFALENDGHGTYYTARALLDPYFEIAPEFAAQGYSMVFSEGINNVPLGEPPVIAPVPLPAGGLLLGAGLAGLGLLRRRRH